VSIVPIVEVAPVSPRCARARGDERDQEARRSEPTYLVIQARDAGGPIRTVAAEDEPSRKPKGVAMSGLECPPATGPEVVVELRRGAVLGLLWLEIEAMRLRLEIDAMRRMPAVELFEDADDEDTWIVRVDPDVWGSRHADRDEDAPLPRRRVFRLRGGKAALKAKASMSSVPDTLLAMAHELVDVLEAELGVAPTAQDAA
jgi:hypothetical protein